MAKITIAGNSFVIASEVSRADFETIKKYRPSVLTLADDETKEMYFKVGIGSNSISDHGVSFGGVSNCEKKVATATLCIPADVEDSKEYVLDKTNLVMVNLGRVEENVKTALEDIQAERSTLAERIVVSV